MITGKFGTSLAIAAAIFCAAAISANASPADEISRAVAKSGAPSVKDAEPSVFVNAFSAVLVRSHSSTAADYVSAAVTMRPDLAGPIVAAALRAHRSDGKDGKNVIDECSWVGPIIRAAIAAAPNRVNDIVAAAIEADPSARECIASAAGQRDGLALFRNPNGVDVGNINSTTIGTINPGSIGGGGQGVPQSSDQPRRVVGK